MYERLRIHKDNKTKDAMQRDCEWAADEIDRLRPMVEWRPIETVPVNQQIILADMSGGNRYVYIGIVYPSTGPGRATHWLPMLPLPNA